jgi:8-oxo-dGTP pyrophosphatase MutT (NUDIX family)
MPRLFNGIVLLAKDVRITGDTLHARFFPVRFASFLAFKELGFSDPEIVNVFAMAALCDAKGDFVLGEMGSHTANAGSVFFPGGTPDMSDVIEGTRVDLAGSVLRELVEETSMRPDDYSVGEGWHVVREGSLMAVMRPVQLADPARDAAERMNAAIARQEDAELSGAVVVGGIEDAEDARIPAFMRAYMLWRMKARG